MFIEAIDRLDGRGETHAARPRRKMTPAEWRDFKKAHNGTH